MGELKVGDKLVTSRRFGTGIDVLTIDRETPAMWMCGHTKIRKDNLRIAGADRWGPYEARIPTDADVSAHRIDVAMGRLKVIRVTAETIDAAEALIAACAALPEQPK